jgi:hypothetical protein
VKIEPGIDIVGAARNFATGMIFPRATPAWSGTTHSISSIRLSESQARASSSELTPRFRSVAGVAGVFFFLGKGHLFKQGGLPETLGFQRFWLVRDRYREEFSTPPAGSGCRGLGSTLTW